MTLVPLHPVNEAAMATAQTELSDALAREREAIAALRESLARQRAAVAMSSAEGVQSTCDEVHRILQMLESARRRRRSALAALGLSSDHPWENLDAGEVAMPPGFAELRAELRTEAEAAAREAAVTHAVLRRAVESGEAYLQALFASANEPTPVYQIPERTTNEALPGFLLDRRA